MALENTMRKGENAGNQHFLLFPHCFLFYQRQESSLQKHSSSAKAVNFVLSKIRVYSRAAQNFALPCPFLTPPLCTQNLCTCTLLPLILIYVHANNRSLLLWLIMYCVSTLQSPLKYTGMQPVLAKYQFSPTNVLHSRTMHYMTLVGKNWYSARIGRMPVELIIVKLITCCIIYHT